MEPTTRYTVTYEVEHFNIFGEWTPAGIFYACRRQSTPALKTQQAKALAQANAAAQYLSKQDKRVRVTKRVLTEDTKLIWDLP